MLLRAKHNDYDSRMASSKRILKVTETSRAALNLVQEAQEQLGIYKTGDLDLKVRVSVTCCHMLQ